MKKKQTKFTHQIYKYMVNIEWSETDQVYLAKVPELRGLVTHGKSLEAAAKQATDAIATWIEGAQESGIPIPEPITAKQPSGRFVTRIRPELHRSLLVKAKQKGKTLNGMVAEILQKAMG